MTEVEAPTAIWSRSFELVYHGPSPRFRGRTPFRDPDDDRLTTDQRMAYLAAYAELLRRAHDLGGRYLSSEVVSDGEAEAVAAALKPQPLPRHRRLVPLRFWRWKLQGDDGDAWVAPEHDDSRWNEMETPTVLDRGRAMLLRTSAQVGPAERTVLDVESIHDEYELWVNGRFVTHHRGYEPHAVEVTALLRPGQENTLALRVAGMPGHQVGIAGALGLVGTRAAFVEELFVKPVEAHEGRPAHLRILATVRNAGAAAFSGQLAVRFSGWFPEEDERTVFAAPPLEIALGPGDAADVAQDCLVPDVELWWPERPRLYRVDAVLVGPDGEPVDDLVDTVGVRTIAQRGGRLFLNGRRFFMRAFGDDLGFAPAADFHGAVCPPDAWIAWDLLLAKRANANAVRLHPWGFGGKPGRYSELGWPEWGTPTDGTNYLRLAEIADQLGVCLVWVTRHWTLWGHGFRAHYREEDMERLLGASLRKVRNRPSIIAYEGLNEVGASLRARVLTGRPESPEPWVSNLSPEEVATLTDLHEERFRAFCRRYVELVNALDGSRLVCPDSMWGPGYQRNPQRPTFVQHEDESIFTMAENLFWDAHDYIGWYTDLRDMHAHRERFWPDQRARPVLLTECGAEAMPDWERYRGLPWRNLWLNNGRPCADTERARLGRPLRVLRDSEAHLSQAYQGLCIQQTASLVRASGCDGMNVNLIADGLAEGNYHKGVCDLHRRAKLGYFAARMAYQPTLVMGMDGDFVLGEGDALRLTLVNDAVERAGRRARVRAEVKDLAGTVVDATEVDVMLDEPGVMPVGLYEPRFAGPGLYQIEYTVTPREG